MNFQFSSFFLSSYDEAEVEVRRRGERPIGGGRGRQAHLNTDEERDNSDQDV
jgi:hypothetical protein